MSDLAITGLLILSLFLILGSGVWIGLTLSGVAWIGMQLLPLLNSVWVDSVVFWLADGVKGGRSPAKRTLDAGCRPVRWPSWPMRHAHASAMTSRSDWYA